MMRAVKHEAPVEAMWQALERYYGVNRGTIRKSLRPDEHISKLYNIIEKREHRKREREQILILREAVKKLKNHKSHIYFDSFQQIPPTSYR